jgi:hypothetical protein
MTIEPNRADSERHIKLLIDPWRQRNDLKIEFRGLRKGQNPTCWLCSPLEDEIEAALDKALRLNDAETARNIYVTVNPVSAAVTSSATDGDILEAHYCFADADEGEAAKRLRDANPPPTFFVQTGSVPENRVHAYWRFEGTTDLLAWTNLQKRIQAKYRTDSVFNPSRILRLAGTVSWPDEKKRDRGYTPEVSKLVEGFK